MPEECVSSVDSASQASSSRCDVTGSNSQVYSAGFAVDKQSFGSLSHFKSSAARLDSVSKLSDSSCESPSCTPAQRCPADLQSKPSLDVPQPVSTTAFDSSKSSRSVECVLWLSHVRLLLVMTDCYFSPSLRCKNY